MASEQPTPSWIMVPVPKELIPEVSDFIIGLVARAATDRWMPDSVEKLLLESDRKTRSLLSVVAAAALDNKEISAQAAADLLRVDEREISVLADAVNEQARIAKRPMLLRITEVAELSPNGETRPQVLFAMNQRVAELVGMAERAARQSNPGS